MDESDYRRSSGYWVSEACLSSELALIAEPHCHWPPEAVPTVQQISVMRDRIAEEHGVKVSRAIASMVRALKLHPLRWPRSRHLEEYREALQEMIERRSFGRYRTLEEVVITCLELPHRAAATFWLGGIPGRTAIDSHNAQKLLQVLDTYVRTMKWT